MTIRQRAWAVLLGLLLLAGFSGAVMAAQAPVPVVRAVMFWMDGCPHCHDVLDRVLPPLQTQYGEQLQIHLVEVVTAEDLDRLYQIAAAVGVPQEYVGVPFLLIGDAALVGSQQIPAELPGLIERHLANGGVDYPQMALLAPWLPEPDDGAAAEQPVEEVSAEAAVSSSATNTEVAAAAPASDGFALAVAVLVGMVLALLYAGLRVLGGRWGGPALPGMAWLRHAIPVLAVAGLAVAAYLAYVETQAVAAVCGPVGDCNAVQTSDYAYLMGIPIGVLGVLGYVAILLVWGWGRRQGDDRASLALLGMTAAGVVFSAYLTYLEPFIIGAVCIWCLTSAVIMTLLLLASVEANIPVRGEARQPARRLTRAGG